MEIFQTLLEINIYASVLVVAIMLLKICLKGKMSPLLHYAVWSLLVLRLIIPVTFQSDIRLITLPAKQLDEQIQVIEETPMQPQPLRQAERVAPRINSNVQTGVSSASVNTPQPEVIKETVLTTPQVLGLIWLVGAAAGMAYLGLLYYILRHNMTKNAVEPSQKLLKLLKEVKDDLNIKANIKLICQYEYGSPALLFPKVILMPMNVLTAMDETQLKYILKHELMHYKRKDHLLSVLLSALNAVYWFNPFIWLAFYKMRQDMETACDSAVVKQLSREKKRDYAALILALFAQPKHKQLLLGMADGCYMNAKQRLKGIYMKKKSKVYTKVICAVCALVLFIGCFTTACIPAIEEPTTAQSAIVWGDSAQSVALGEEQENESAAPKQIKWTQEYKGTSDDDRFEKIVDVNATVNIPDPYTSSVFADSDRWFTQEEFDTMLKYFIGDAKLYDSDLKPTKVQLEEQLARQRVLFAERSKTPIFDDMDREEREAMEKWFVEQEERIKTAPLTSNKEYIDTTLKTFQEKGQDMQVLYAFADLETGTRARINFWNEGAGYFSVSIDDTSIADQLACAPKLNGVLNEQNAIALAKQVLEEMGIRNFDCIVVKDFVQKTAIKRVIFRPKLNGHQVMQGANLIPIVPNPDDQYYGWRENEEIHVDVSANGVVGFLWKDCATGVQAVAQDVALLPFEEIQAMFQERFMGQTGLWQYDYNLASGVNADEILERYGASSQRYSVNRIEFGLLRVWVKGKLEFRYIPAWNFYGTFENDDIGAFQISPLLSLNAMDGSNIDRRYVFEDL